MDQPHANKENAMIKKILSTVALLAVILSSGELRAESTAKELIKQAEAAQKDAADIGYEWLGTGALIKNAQDALEKGQEQEARNFAQRALREGKLAFEQGQNMKKNWESYIPKL